MNPILVNVTRGDRIESQHRGAYCVVNSQGEIVMSDGDIDTPTYPRSSIKIIQALALVESGAVERFGLSDDEVALACSSHNGEEIHARTAESILTKVGLTKDDLKCGTHWPMNEEIGRLLARKGGEPCSLHNNCSGKHSGFLAYLQQAELPLAGYLGVDHPLQIKIRETLGEVCDIDLTHADYGIDGCAIPTWALPLKNLALGFAKMAKPEENFEPKRAAAITKLTESVFAHPYMVAGKDRYDSTLMRAIPHRVFVKVGAEGVFCAFSPKHGYGIALKCDDGAVRGAETILSGLLDKLGIITKEEFKQNDIWPLFEAQIKNRNGDTVGVVTPCL